MPKKTSTTPEKTPKAHDHADHAAPSLIAKNTVITITIPWKTAEPAYKKARAQVAGTVKIAGFRKGKVPPDVAEKMLGTADIIEKALEQILPTAYIETVQKEKKQPLSQPAFRGVSLEVGKDWVIDAEIAEKPAVTLGDYKKTVKEARKHVEEELAKREKELAEKNKEPKATESDKSAPKPQALSTEQKQEMILQHIYQHLIEDIQPQIPELLVRREVEYDIDQLGRQLQSINMTFQQYLERRSMTQENLTQQMAMGALGRLQLLFISDAIATENKLEVSDSEVEKYLEEKIDKAMREQYRDSAEYKRLLTQTILRQKVTDFLLAI